VPKRPTRETTPVNIELPTELVERVRNFARRDMRSIKAEFIRALQLLLDTYDRPPTTEAATTQRIETPSADTLPGARPPSLPTTAPQRMSSPLEKLDKASFDELLRRLEKKRPLLSELAKWRREGLSAEEIVATDATLQLPAVRDMIEQLEKTANDMIEQREKTARKGDRRS